MNRDDINVEGVLYIPRYVKQNSDMEFGSVVTHENYNEKLNLNTSQGDYNTDILKLLFGQTNPAEVPHVKYLDKIIEEQYTEMSDRITAQQDIVDNCNTLVQGMQDTVSTLSTDVLNIINGVTKVGVSQTADSITGVAEAGLSKYYGTDRAGSVGFHSMPAAVYVEDSSSYIPEMHGIYIEPKADSVTEAMLTPDLRTKINRETISDYDVLDNRPLIAGHLLTGDLSLTELGIQPAGNYITEIPDLYATKQELQDAVNPKMDTTVATNTFAQIQTVNTLINQVGGLTTVVDNNKEYAEGRYARVGIGSLADPKPGDILITL